MEGHHGRFKALQTSHGAVPIKIGIAGRVNTQLASTRFRILIPARNIEGYEYVLGCGDITIIPKGLPFGDIKRLTGKLLWDVSDDHFEDEPDYYRTVPKLVDVVTCTTEYLRDRIKEETGVEAVVISDPLEFRRQEPQVGEVNKLFWYGHKSNLQALADLDLDDYEVLRVTNMRESWCIEWSEEAMKAGFDWCDAVIIPVKKSGGGADARAKSPNRMTEAINAGRFVVANDMPAYRPYGMWLGDIHEGLEWLEQNPSEALQRLKEAQKLVTKLHDPKTIASQWKALFDLTLGVGKSSGRASST